MDISITLNMISSDKQSVIAECTDLDLHQQGSTFAIYIFQRGELFDEIMWSTTVGPFTRQSTTFYREVSLKPGNYLCGALQSTDGSWQLEPALTSLQFRSAWQIRDAAVRMNDAWFHDLQKAQLEERLTPIRTIAAANASNTQYRQFELTLFFQGLKLYSSLPLRGMTLNPISDGMDAVTYMSQVQPYLLAANNANLSTWRDEIATNPIFAIVFHNFHAIDAEDALTHAKEIGGRISTILGLDSHARPKLHSAFILDQNTSHWNCQMLTDGYRGNLIAPFSSTGPARQIQYMLPIISRHKVARLVLELFIQARAEIDLGFRIFRLWSLIELISNRNVSRSAQPVTDPTGSTIKLGSGRDLTCERADGRVYQHLCNLDIPPILKGRQIFMGSNSVGYDNEGAVNLWQQVAAAFRTRNAVAHDGDFELSIFETNAGGQLPDSGYDLLGFIDHAASIAVRSEIARIASAETM